MKILGIIVEYNPLHNGHVYHINEIKRQYKPDLVITVMSGSITMRGDLSVYDKFKKTRQALLNSSDIVIELPLIYSMQRSDIFSKNAVDLLSYMGVNEIWIGSEENNIALYKKYYDMNLTVAMDNGSSYKANSYKDMPFSSNDILGYGYYKAIRDNNYPILLKTIKREASNYLDNTPTHESITSALSIRNDISLIKDYCPDFVNGETLDEERLFPLIKYKLLSTSASDLRKLFFVDEGLENRLSEVYKFNSLKDFIKHLTTKRYTSTRIKRMLMYILFNVSKEEANSVINEKIAYVRVLGYSPLGKEYLSSIKKNVLIYTNIKDGLNKALDIELRVSRILDSVYDLNLMALEQKGPQTI